jgi:hypothetical protein
MCGLPHELLKSHQETETKKANAQNSISDHPAIDLGLRAITSTNATF